MVGTDYLIEKVFWVSEIKRFLCVIPFINLGAIWARHLLAVSFNPEFSAEFLPELYTPLIN